MAGVQGTQLSRHEGDLLADASGQVSDERRASQGLPWRHRQGAEDSGSPNGDRRDEQRVPAYLRADCFPAMQRQLENAEVEGHSRCGEP